MKRLLSRASVVVLAAFGLMSAADANAAGKINVLCSADLEWCQLMKARFEKESGVQVSMIRKSAGESFAQIQAQARNPQVDVWWAGSGDAHLQAAFEGGKGQRPPADYRLRISIR